MPMLLPPFSTTIVLPFPLIAGELPETGELTDPSCVVCL
jgi:hypothetical protein